MREERKFKASHFENIQELIASCIIWIKTDDYDAYCRFFDMGAMEELIKELNNLKEIEKSHQEENGKLRVELEQEKEKNKTKVDIKDIEFSNFIKERYVSKDKIKEKIEETNNEKLNYSEDEYYLENEIKGYAIDKLKELLEEK